VDVENNLKWMGDEIAEWH
uniref:Uncharacterized protein n=1 Tax=Steinernema glaseri TaxID=37863 RepID=A0A1I7ZY87_9BILA